MEKVQLPLNCAILWPICVNQGAVMFAYWYNSSGPSIDVSHERKDYSFLQFFRNIKHTYDYCTLIDTNRLNIF